MTHPARNCPCCSPPVKERAHVALLPCSPTQPAPCMGDVQSNTSDKVRPAFPFMRTAWAIHAKTNAKRSTSSVLIALAIPAMLHAVQPPRLLQRKSPLLMVSPTNPCHPAQTGRWGHTSKLQGSSHPVHFPAPNVTHPHHRSNHMLVSACTHTAWCVPDAVPGRQACPPPMATVKQDASVKFNSQYDKQVRSTINNKSEQINSQLWQTSTCHSQW